MTVLRSQIRTSSEDFRVRFAHNERLAKERGWQFYGFIGGGYRFMCSWATQIADIDALAVDLAEVLQRSPRPT